MSRPHAVDLAARVTSGAPRPTSESGSSTATSEPPATVPAEAVAELQRQVGHLLGAQERSNTTNAWLTRQLNELRNKVTKLESAVPPAST